MDTQKFTLLISLGSSIAVVLISSATNLWAKRIDAKQKKQDRDFEFSKIYMARKIDAAEDIISNNSLVIMHTGNIEQLLAAYVEDYGYYYKEGEAEIDRQVKESNSLMQTAKSTYRLYFDTDDNRNALADMAYELNVLSNSIIRALNFKKLLARKIDENTLRIEPENEGNWDEVQKEIEELMEKYRHVNTSFKESLKANCEYFREKLKRYDMQS